MSAGHVLEVIEDPRFQEHEAPRGHPERPERLDAVHQALQERAAAWHPVAARPASAADIQRVHSAAHLQRIEDAIAQAPVQLDADTYLSTRSHQVALLASGAAVELAGRIATGKTARGIAAVRPPGHHAEANRAMGFCIFNNIAVAARALQAEHGLSKILVLDWDVHHGNGTQHSFEDDPSVLYVSTHQSPYYPGTGAVGEAGEGAGLGSTVNIPMPAGCGDAEYIGAFQRILVPVAQCYAPEMILVSCGFDAHREDPLASMDVSGEGFLAMTRIVRRLADELCEGRCLFVLEGGYSLSGLLDSTRALLTGLLEDSPALPVAVEAAPGSPLRSIVEGVVGIHGARFPGLGAA